MDDVEAANAGRTIPHVGNPENNRPKKSPKTQVISPNGDDKSQRRSDRTRLTISLSERSMRAFDELKQITDADTDSEVFRNALRLHQALIHAHIAGDTILIRKKGDADATAISLFVQDDTASANINDDDVNGPHQPGSLAARRAKRLGNGD